MSAQRGQVIWSAAETPSVPQSFGLEAVSFTDRGDPDHLDQEDGEEVVQRFHEVAIVLGESEFRGNGALCITNRFGLTLAAADQGALVRIFPELKKA